MQDTNENLKLYKMSEFLKSSSIFSKLNDDQLFLLSKNCYECNFLERDILLKEGDTVKNLFIIIEGKVDIMKKGENEDQMHILVSLGVGTCIGDLEILDQNVSSATVIAKTAVKAISISYDNIYEFIKNNKDSYKLLIQLGKRIGEDLRNTNVTATKAMERELHESKIRIALGNTTLVLINWICFFSFITQWLSIMSSKIGNTTWITIPLSFTLAATVLMVLVRSGIPLKNYGLTLDYWKESTVLAIFYSIWISLLVIFCKWILIKFVPGYENVNLIDFSNIIKQLSITHMVNGKISYLAQIKWWTFYFVIYCLISSSAQEFPTRCGLQASLESFIAGRFAKFQALLTANFVFAVFHLFISIEAAILSFLLALPFSVLFMRYRTLIGPCVCHSLAGGAILFVIGVPGAGF